MAMGSSGSFVLHRCARQGGCSSGAASSLIMLQNGGLSPCVASPVGDGVGAAGEGQASPSTSLVSLLVTATTGLSTNSLRNRISSLVTPSLVVCFPFWVCLHSVSGSRDPSCGIGSSSFRRGDDWWPSSAALRYVNAICMLFLVPIKTYVSSEKGISLKLHKVALIDSDDKSFNDRDVIFPFSKMFL